MARKPLSVLLNGVTQFGSLTVLGEEDGEYVPGNGAPRLLRCQCACGTIKLFPFGNVKRGLSKSCGCERGDRVRAIKITHGDNIRGRVAPEYRSWSHSIGRCENPTDKSFSAYGGRGISVCKRWRDSYEAFLEDMGRRPSPRHSLDRIEVDGNYEPGNCRWAVKEVQDRNKRTNRWLVVDGERICLTDAARKFGIVRRTLETRLDRGWSVERALKTPAK